MKTLLSYLHDVELEIERYTIYKIVYASQLIGYIKHSYLIVKFSLKIRTYKWHVFLIIFYTVFLSVMTYLLDKIRAMNIFLFESDISINQEISHLLRLDGYSVSRVYSQDEAIDVIDDGFCYDLYFLSSLSNNCELASYILEKDSNAKIIILGNDSDIKTISKAYEIGCIDYIKKPFDIRELGLKVNFYKPEYLIYITDDLYFDRNLMRLYNKEVEVNLGAKELRLLYILVLNIDKIVMFETLYHKLYNDETSLSSLRALIKRLKEKIGSEHLVSINKRGYMICSSVF